MFTGIVEAVGSVARIVPGSGKTEIAIRAPELAGELTPGDSISVDGACQTVVRADAGSFTVEAIGTTLSRTAFGRYEEGSRVNLERAVPLGGRLGGHLVQGHVDGVGTVRRIERSGEFVLVDVELPEVVARVTVLHGSIAVNGVSLTVNALPETGVAQVAIIPYTWEETTFSELAEGDPVNLEGDLIGKYVGSLLEARGNPGDDAPDAGGVSGDELEEWGY